MQPAHSVDRKKTPAAYLTVRVCQVCLAEPQLSDSLRGGTGYTGQVWFHQWHGDFIAEAESAD